MRAMVLEAINRPLQLRELEVPQPQGHQVLLRVRACGVCRTDLHIYEGDLPHPKLPLVLGHEIVGEVVALGPEVRRFRVGQRVGVPWLGSTCGRCRYCQKGLENLCEQARFTGYTQDGATPSTPWPRKSTALLFRKGLATSRPLPCSARG